MDATRYTDFEQLVRMLNDAEIVPIVSGGFALEILLKMTFWMMNH